MTYDFDIAEFTLTGPLPVAIGWGGDPVWVVVSNNTVNGSPTGIDVTLSVTPAQGPPPIIGYGTVKHYYFRQGIKWLQVNGTGANITMTINEDDVPLQVTNVTVAATSGTGNVNVAQVAGSAPNLAKETGGELAGIAGNTATSAGAVQNIGGIPMVAVSPQDPPQVAVTGGKAIPVKTET